MTRLTGFLILCGTLLSGGIALAAVDQSKACDLKTVEDGLYCEDCEEILEGDAIEKKLYCAACYESATEAEETPEKATKIKVCVKSAFQCPDCSELSPSAGTCAECDVKLEKATVKARVIFACQECGTAADKEGLCDEEDCREMKAKVVRTCDQSGTFPHGHE